MKVGKRVLLLATIMGAIGLAVSAAPALAHDGHPVTGAETLVRTCSWSVDKRASDTSLILSTGQVSPAVTYTIVVSATCTDMHQDEHGGLHAPDGHPTTGTTIVNECVIVDDSYTGTGSPQDLEVCLDDLVHGSLTITYTKTFGPFHTCGEFDFTNTVNVTSTGPHGGQLLATDSVTVHVSVPCATGCTLTQGYWKTHADPTTKKFDDTWLLLPGGLGANTVFFLSGQTWIQVFNTSPAGNAYYNLAHQYMAARLNVLNGASVPGAVTTAINQATTLFNTYTPAQIGALKGSDPLRQQFISLAGTLGSYNEGATGPGHCDE